MRKKILLFAIGLTFAGLLTGCKSQDYKEAQELYESGNYTDAIAMYEELGDYKDSASQLTASKFLQACQLQNEGKYDDAIKIYDEIGSYEASDSNKEKCYMAKANAFLEEKNYEEALAAVENYKDTEEGKHIADICNVHINGMDGLMTYMEENIEPNDSGDYAESVKTGKDNSTNVLIWYDKDGAALKEKVTIDDSGSDSANTSFELTLAGKDAGSYTLIMDSLQKVSSVYAYYHDTLMIGNNYYVGSVINAFGSVDLAKFKKGKTIKIKDFTITSSAEDIDKDEAKKIAQGTITPSTQLGLEGFQQFLNEQDLRISIAELGIKKYECIFAEDPYSITHEVGDYSADSTISGQEQTVSNTDSNSTVETSKESATVSSEATSTDTSQNLSAEGNIDVTTANGKAVYNSSEIAPDEFIAYDEDKGKKIIIVNFDYTNLEDSEKSFNDDFYVSAYQNSVELESFGVVYESDVCETVDNYSKNVLKDGTLTVGEFFVLQDDSPVTITLHNNSGDEDVSESMTVNIK